MVYDPLLRSTPEDSRAAANLVNESYPLMSDSSLPTAIPSAPQTCPAPCNDFRVLATSDPPPTAAAGAAAAGAAAAGAAAAVVPSPARCFKYSSKEGAAEMDLRGSSSTLASGLRVSAIPPAPMCWLRAELVRTCSILYVYVLLYIFRFVIVMIRLSVWFIIICSIVFE